MVVNLNRGGVRMATKTVDLKIFCIDDSLVLMENDEVIKEIQIPEKELKKEIVRQIKKEKKLKIRPVEIFRSAIFEIIGICVKPAQYKYRNKGIQDSIFYRKYLKFIIEDENTQRKMRRQESETQAKKIEEKKQESYRELSIETHYRIIKKIN